MDPGTARLSGKLVLLLWTDRTLKNGRGSYWRKDPASIVPANRRALVATCAGWSTHVDFAESGLRASRLQEISIRDIPEDRSPRPYCDIGSACPAGSLNKADFRLPAPQAHRWPLRPLGSTHARGQFSRLGQTIRVGHATHHRKLIGGHFGGIHHPPTESPVSAE